MNDRNRLKSFQLLLLLVPFEQPVDFLHSEALDFSVSTLLLFGFLFSVCPFCSSNRSVAAVVFLVNTSLFQYLLPWFHTSSDADEFHWTMYLCLYLLKNRNFICWLFHSHSPEVSIEIYWYFLYYSRDVLILFLFCLFRLLLFYVYFEIWLQTECTFLFARSRDFSYIYILYPLPGWRVLRAGFSVLRILVPEFRLIGFSYVIWLRD